MRSQRTLRTRTHVFCRAAAERAYCIIRVCVTSTSLPFRLVVISDWSHLSAAALFGAVRRVLGRLSCCLLLLFLLDHLYADPTLRISLPALESSGLLLLLSGNYSDFLWFCGPLRGTRTDVDGHT